MGRRGDMVVAALCEAALILVAGLAGWAAHKPLLFASLGPTAYEMIETPERRTARPYNVLAGHMLAVLAGLFALWVTHAGAAPRISVDGVPLVRVAAGVLAAGLTVLVTLLADASQPAAVSTALLLSLGVMQGWRGGAEIMAAVALITAIGEPLRRWRAHVAQDEPKRITISRGRRSGPM